MQLQMTTVASQCPVVVLAAVAGFSCCHCRPSGGVSIVWQIGNLACARGLPYHLASICSGVGAAVLQIRLKGSPVIPKRSRITPVSQCHTWRVWKEMESDYEYLMPGEKIENCVILAAKAVKSAVRFSHIQGGSVGLVIEVADCLAFVQHNGMCVLPCDRTERKRENQD